MRFIVQLMELYRAWACLVPLVLLLCGVLWLTLPKHHRQLLPPQRLRFVPSLAPMEIFGVVVIFVIVLSMAGSIWNEIAGEPAASDKAFRQNAIVLTAFPIIIALSWAILHFAGKNRPYQVGVHFGRWRQFAILGGLTFLAATPAILLVNYIVALLVDWLGLSPPSHSLTEVVRGIDPALEWTVVLLCALVAAPIMEEFLYRGVVQRWTVQNSAGANSLFVLALLFTVMNSGKYTLDSSFFATFLLLVYLVVPVFCRRGKKEKKAAQDHKSEIADNVLQNDENKSTAITTERDFWGNYQPDGPLNDDHPVRRIDKFVTIQKNWLEVYCPNFDLTGRNRNVMRVRGVMAPALLFAGMHPWPTPIPLFVLGLVLGWLAYRTQSLVAPIVVHLLFNGVACIHLAMDLQKKAGM